MSRSDDLRVQDILDAADQILDVVNDGRDIWAKDRLRQLAVERLLEIIGESANALSDDFRAQRPDVPWRDIISLRIVLAHHYHRVDPNQVWVIAASEVPQLAEQLRAQETSLPRLPPPHPGVGGGRRPACSLGTAPASVMTLRLTASPGRKRIGLSR